MMRNLLSSLRRAFHIRNPSGVHFGRFRRSGKTNRRLVLMSGEEGQQQETKKMAEDAQEVQVIGVAKEEQQEAAELENNRENFNQPRDDDEDAEDIGEEEEEEEAEKDGDDEEGEEAEEEDEEEEEEEEEEDDDEAEEAGSGYDGDATTIEADISHCELDDDRFIQEFLPIFKQHTSCEILIANENYIGNNSLRALARVLKRGGHTALRVLRIDCCHHGQIRDEGLIALVGVLPKACPALRTLSVCAREVDDTTIDFMIGVLEKKTGLDYLEISYAQSEGSCAVVAEALSRGWPSLRKLSIYVASLKGARAVLLAARLSNLTYLDLAVVRTNNFAYLADGESQETTKRLRYEFPCMVVLCSVRDIARLGAGNQCALQMLPKELIRRIAPMLYELSDLEEFMYEEE